MFSNGIITDTLPEHFAELEIVHTFTQFELLVTVLRSSKATLVLWYQMSEGKYVYFTSPLNFLQPVQFLVLLNDSA